MGNGISVQYEHLALIGFFMILCESMGKYFSYVLQERARIVLFWMHYYIYIFKCFYNTFVAYTALLFYYELAYVTIIKYLYSMYCNKIILLHPNCFFCQVNHLSFLWDLSDNSIGAWHDFCIWNFTAILQL